MCTYIYSGALSISWRTKKSVKFLAHSGSSSKVASAGRGRAIGQSMSKNCPSTHFQSNGRAQTPDKPCEVGNAVMGPTPLARNRGLTGHRRVGHRRPALPSRKGSVQKKARKECASSNLFKNIGYHTDRIKSSLVETIALLRVIFWLTYYNIQRRGASCSSSARVFSGLSRTSACGAAKAIGTTECLTGATAKDATPERAASAAGGLLQRPALIRLAALPQADASQIELPAGLVGNLPRSTI